MNEPKESPSPERVLLRWALYITLGAVLLFAGLALAAYTLLKLHPDLSKQVDQLNYYAGVDADGYKRKKLENPNITPSQRAESKSRKTSAE